MGLIIQVYSIEFWVIKGYHPLRDTSFIIILAGTWIFSMVVEEFIKTGGKLGKLWVVDLKKQALIFETKT